MNTEQLTEKVFEHSEKIAKHEEDIKTLFNLQKTIEKLADSTHEVAESVRALTIKAEDTEGRLNIIEGEKRQKNYAVWQIAVSAALGAVITFLITNILS